MKTFRKPQKLQDTSGCRLAMQQTVCNQLEPNMHLNEVNKADVILYAPEKNLLKPLSCFGAWLEWLYFSYIAQGCCTGLLLRVVPQGCCTGFLLGLRGYLPS